MLLCEKEQTVLRLNFVCAEKAADGAFPVGKCDASRFVVLDSSCETITAKGQQTRSGTERRVHVESPNRIQGIELTVQSVTAIFGREQDIFAGKGQIIEGSMIGIAENDDREGSGLAMLREIHTENRTPGTACCERRLVTGTSVCVAGSVEEEGLEPRAGLKSHVLGALERRSPNGFGGGIRVKRCGAIDSSVVYGYPLDRPDCAEGVELELIVRKHIAERISGVGRDEYQRLSVDRD